MQAFWVEMGIQGPRQSPCADPTGPAPSLLLTRAEPLLTQGDGGKKYATRCGGILFSGPDPPPGKQESQPDKAKRSQTEKTAGKPADRPASRPGQPTWPPSPPAGSINVLTVSI